MGSLPRTLPEYRRHCDNERMRVFRKLYPIEGDVKVCTPSQVIREEVGGVSEAGFKNLLKKFRGNGSGLIGRLGGWFVVIIGWDRLVGELCVSQ